MQNNLARLRQKYNDVVKAQLFKEFKHANVMQTAKITKITLNMGLGQDALTDKKNIMEAKSQLEAITGQRAVITKARKSIAGFKIREGWPLGLKVTLRGNRMYEFLDRFMTLALPRTRDFRGVNPRGFDGRGNYSLGIKEQIIFPEIEYDKIDKIRGLNICINTTAGTNEEAYALLKAMGMPFREETRG